LKYFSIAFHVDATGHCFVAAETEEKAKEIAKEEFFPDDDNTELGDVIDMVDCVELSPEELKNLLKYSRQGVMKKQED